MSNLGQALWVELLKARRSRMPLLTALAFAMLALVDGFFTLVLRDPELARRIGLVSAKARLTMGGADWPSFLGFLTLAVAGGGIVLFGFIAAWVFGREYADRTAKDLLALPTSRSSIVLAKFLLVMSWSAALTALLCALGLGVGAALSLPSVPPQAFWQALTTLAVAAGLTVALVTPIAFFAGAGHGYLAPIGFAMLAIFLAQVVAAAGWGEYFPWAVPGLYAQGSALGAVSYVLVFLTGAVGMAATFLWWERADQAR